MKKLLLILLLIPNLVMASEFDLACSAKDGFLMVIKVDLDKKTLFQKSTLIKKDEKILNANAGEMNKINEFWEILKWNSQFILARQEGIFLGVQTETLWRLNLDTLELRRTDFDIGSQLGIFSCLRI